MFRNILVPISSEFYLKEVFERSVSLAKIFNSKVDLIYIIEEKTLNQTDKITGSFRTPYDMDETKKQIIRKQVTTADSIVFQDADFYFKNEGIRFEKSIERGEFSKVIEIETNEKNYDLILMGFEKDTILNYRVLDDLNIPIWIETKNKADSILAVCSNLLRNKKVPEVTMKLADAFNYTFHMVYIFDKQYTIDFNETGEITGKKSKKDLITKAQNFVETMEKKGIDVEIIEGSLERETIKQAKIKNADLVIIGREKMKKSNLGIPIRHFKRKLAEKCGSSMLFFD